MWREPEARASGLSERRPTRGETSDSPFWLSGSVMRRRIQFKDGSRGAASTSGERCRLSPAGTSSQLPAFRVLQVPKSGESVSHARERVSGEFQAVGQKSFVARL